VRKSTTSILTKFKRAVKKLKHASNFSNHLYKSIQRRTEMTNIYELDEWKRNLEKVLDKLKSQNHKDVETIENLVFNGKL
jgi:hypothetical protein